MNKSRIIKKYPNRRLYDTEISSYITLEDIRQLVIDNEAFEVRDVKTGENITRAVLLQIIAEHEQHGQPMFSTQLLSQIIRFYGDSLQSFMGTYLEQSLQAFLDQSHQFRGQMSGMMGQGPWNMMNEMAKTNFNLWRSLQEQFLASAKSTFSQTPPPPAKDPFKK